MHAFARAMTDWLAELETSAICVSLIFFSSRRRHTISDRDWSSDCALPICFRSRHEPMKILYLCNDPGIELAGKSGAAIHIQSFVRALADLGHEVAVVACGLRGCKQVLERSEERRVGEECRSRLSPYH